MGIPGLRQLLKQKAPNSMQQKTVDEYSGQKIAIDANIVLFEFKATLGHLKNEKTKQPTGHLMGFLQRTARFLSLKIDPIYVFDGDTLSKKRPGLERRRAGRFVWTGKSVEALQRYKECRRLLLLMGVACIKAPDEGEAQCCYLLKTNQVNAVASEDSDCLTYGAKKVLVNFKATKNTIVREYDHEMMLGELGLTKDACIDFCILAGCDYCDTIEGMDGEKALELIRQFGSIEIVLKNIDRNKYQISEKWLAQYKDARRQFTKPQVFSFSDNELKCTREINVKGLELFLKTENHFQQKS